MDRSRTCHAVCMGLSSSLPSKEAPEALAGSVPLVDSRLPPAVIGRCWRRCSAEAADGTADAKDDGIGVGNTHSPSSGFVTVMNFNVLADAYCTPRAHPCAKQYRKWRFRRWKILREIETHACDFVCLQEVRSYVCTPPACCISRILVRVAR